MIENTAKQQRYIGKTVVVTGAGAGIGLAIAAAYAAEGANVVIAEKQQTTGQAAAELLHAQGGSALFVACDVSQPEQIAALMAAASAAYGGIDIVVNNAGFGIGKPPGMLAVEDWDLVLNTNLRSVFLCAREAAPFMKQRGRGAIVNIASTRAKMSEPNSEAYAASKGGILALTHALAASYAADRIQVNAISPGWIETGDYAKLREEDHRQHWAGRVGKPADIARACLYLTDEQNDFISGINLVVDGGMTRKMIYLE